MKNVEIMQVFNALIQNSILKGTSFWFKAISIFLFSVIMAILIFSFVMLIAFGPDMNIRFGY